MSDGSSYTLVSTNLPTTNQVLTTDSDGNNQFASSLVDTGNLSPWNLYLGSDTGNNDPNPLANAFVGIFVGSNIENPGVDDGSYNTGLGIFALQEITTGTNNTGTGFGSLNGLLSGTFNTSNGNTCLHTLTIGSFNTGAGANALQNTITANYSTALGYQAGFNNNDDHNTFIGNSTGLTATTCTYLTVLGDSANVGTDGITNAMALGANTLVSANNSVNIGDGVNVGLNMPSPLSVLHIAAGPTSNLADLRFEQSSATPTTSTTTSSLYVNGSNNLLFQPGTGSVINLSSSISNAIPKSTFTAGGQLISSTASSTLSLVSAGTVGQVLISNGASTPGWGSRLFDTGSSGSFVYFAGSSSGNATYSGVGTAAAGVAVLSALTSGDQNVGFGQNLFNSVTDGENNTGVGSGSGTAVINGSGNTILGCEVVLTGANATGQMGLGFGVEVTQDYSVNIGYDSAGPGACNVGFNQPAPQETIHVSAGTDGAGGVSNTAAIYLDASSSAPASVSSNDAAIYVESAKLKFVSGSSFISGTIAGAQSGVTCGVAILTGTTPVVISTTAVTPGSIILISHSTAGSSPTLANMGTLVEGNRSTGASFSVYSTNVLDTANVNWFIINP